jgi:hypothetical protein
MVFYKVDLLEDALIFLAICLTRLCFFCGHWTGKVWRPGIKYHDQQLNESYCNRTALFWWHDVGAFIQALKLNRLAVQAQLQGLPTFLLEESSHSHRTGPAISLKIKDHWLIDIL